MTLRARRRLAALVTAGACVHAAAQPGPGPGPAEEAPGPGPAAPVVAQIAAPPAAPAPAAAPALAPARGGLVRGEGLLMLDYQKIPVAGEPAIDLLGFHLLNRVSEGVYLGVGAFAPLLRGDYGGFMAFDATAHLQRRLAGRLFGVAGVAAGGGGGGRSVAQSRELSGTGGFAKVYAGLGWDFDDVAVGLNVSRLRFQRSAIDHSQLNLFVQWSFDHRTGAYEDAGQPLGPGEGPAWAEARGENTLALGLDNLFQRRPTGSRKDTIRMADLQFAHYLARDTYWYVALGVGYHGLPLYNQLIGGLGQRWRLSERWQLHAQLGVGSGGYAPDSIDTGSGLLVYPKLSAEFALTRRLGLALSAGALVAPRGSSRNATLGAALNYRIQSGEPAGGADGGGPVELKGIRFALFHQSAFDVRYKGLDRSGLRLLSVQVDQLLGPHLYLPVQAAVATNAYLGYPGYGELMAGLGWQTRHVRGDRLQAHAQLLAGTNVHGAIVKAGLGLDIALGERLALQLNAGHTVAPRARDGRFRSSTLGVGLAYRFSVPSG
ncbi:hypothetical protein [Piscinibacter sakaiensis]|uniref:Uncharacterized protein n=1 Tax=Piscinibacter sakaiensis TaxID=1547922 RepID=A0A0K8NYD9_PISS1|nr:hypothetical protein [Piscinibacter sakaiensis]GAP35388.1 hypothetical protein ISF6_1159 [Piscinibacter sakaiensis]